MGKALPIVIAVVIILVLASVVIFVDFPRQAVIQNCPGGLTALSISDARITTSNDLNGKQVIRVTAVANGGGECLTINWDNDLLEDAIGDGTIVENSVFGSLVTKSQTQTYTSSQNSQPVFKVFKSPKQEGFFCSISNCQLTFPGTIDARNLFPTGCDCVYKDLIGTGGQLDAGLSRDFEVEFSIEGAGQPVTLTASRQSGTIGSRAFIKWNGDLMSNRWLGTPDYDSFLSDIDGEWRLTEDGFYDDIADRLEEDTEPVGFLGGGCLLASSTSQINSCITQYNAFVDLKTANKDNEFISREDLVEDADWNGRKLEADLATFTTWQVFTIDLDAAFVGIHKNVGQPEVDCPSGRPKVISGSSFESVYEVRDKSGTRPAFSLELECDNPGTGTLETNRISNVRTSFRDIDATISSTTTTDRDFSCTFTARDLNNPSNKDSCTANYEAVAFTGCTPDQRVCSTDASQLGICNAEGDAFSFVDCDFGCEAFENTFRCRLQTKEICDNGIDDDGNGLIDGDDPQCKFGDCEPWFGVIPNFLCIINNAINAFRIWFAVIVGLLAGILGAVLSRDFTKDQSGKTQTITMIIAGILAALLIGYVAFIFFWVAIIILVLGVIIKIIL